MYDWMVFEYEVEPEDIHHDSPVPDVEVYGTVSPLCCATGTGVLIASSVLVPASPSFMLRRTRMVLKRLFSGSLLQASAYSSWKNGCDMRLPIDGLLSATVSIRQMRSRTAASIDGERMRRGVWCGSRSNSCDTLSRMLPFRDCSRTTSCVNTFRIPRASASLGRTGLPSALPAGQSLRALV